MRFDASRAEELLSEKRKIIQPLKPFEDFLFRLNINKDVAFDIGAGNGYFTIPLSKHFKKVYAVEANKEMAFLLKKRLDSFGIKNVGIIISEKPLTINFKPNLILFANVLHEIDDVEGYIEWSTIADIVIVIDWKKIKTEFGPSLDERIDENDAINMLKKYFKVERLNYYKYHYFLVCKNKNRKN